MPAIDFNGFSSYHWDHGYIQYYLEMKDFVSLAILMN